MQDFAREKCKFFFNFAAYLSKLSQIGDFFFNLAEFRYSNSAKSIVCCESNGFGRTER